MIATQDPSTCSRNEHQKRIRTVNSLEIQKPSRGIQRKDISPSPPAPQPCFCPSFRISSPSVIPCGSRENPLFHGAPGSDPGKARLGILLPILPTSTLNPSPPSQATSLPDNVVVVSQEEFLAVLAGVVNHPDTSNEVDHLLAGGVIQVVAALVTPVPVHPLQPELAAGSCPIRHDKPTPLAPTPRGSAAPPRRLCPR